MGVCGGLAVTHVLAKSPAVNLERSPSMKGYLVGVIRR